MYGVRELLSCYIHAHKLYFKYVIWSFICFAGHCIIWCISDNNNFLHPYRPDLELSRITLSPISTCNIIIGNMRHDRSAITGPCWDHYWVVSILSPILFIVLIVKSILLIIRNELFWKFFIIHILAVIVSSFRVELFCIIKTINMCLTLYLLMW